jgi:hypothetical protein
MSYRWTIRGSLTALIIGMAAGSNADIIRPSKLLEQQDATAIVYKVNSSKKGDRLVPALSARSAQLPIGCEKAFSNLIKISNPHAHAHCVT